MTPASGLDALYPFLSASPGGTDDASAHATVALLDEARRSTAAKIDEATALRGEVLAAADAQLDACAAAMAAAFAAGATLYTFGNGGSSTDAAAVASLFLHPGGVRPDAIPLPAVALSSDVAVTTALANDIGFEAGLARHLSALASPGDIALGLSTSGSSENLINAFAAAKRRGLLTVGLAGYRGGRMAESDAVDHLFVVASSSVHRIQEAQTTLYHVLWSRTQAAVSAAALRKS